MKSPESGVPYTKSAFGLPPGFLRKNLIVICAWPACALLLACLLWVLTLSVLDRDRAAVRDQAFKQAASLSRAYAEQLQRTVAQIDQLTLSLKFDWEEPQGTLNLERQHERGVYPGGSMLYATIIDRNGEIVTSTFKSARRVTFADRPHFQSIKKGEVKGLHISEPDYGVRLGRTVIRFSRGLVTPTGDFNGIATVAVEPSFLGSFYDESDLGKNDFVSARFTHGPLLVTKVGGNAGMPKIYYRDDPVFKVPAGILVETEDKFGDGHSRIVAWKKLDKYPLVALAALSEADVYASYAATARSYLAYAAAGSLLLFMFAVVGSMLSARLAWRRHKEEEVKQTYRLAVDAAREGFYMLRPMYDHSGAAIDFILEDCNERAAAMINSSKAALIGAQVLRLYPGEYGEMLCEKLRHALEVGFYEDEIRVSPPSRLNTAWVYRKVVRSGAGLALTIRDISDIKAHEQELSNLANADTLTMLPNRHWLNNYLPVAIEQAKNSGGSLAVLFIDLDDFKNINDTLGHVAGDELLKAAAARLRSLIRASDHVVRLGGDEFTIILERVNRFDDVSRVAKMIVNALAEPFTVVRSSGHRVRASIGISLFPQDGEDGETLLKHADVAMYAAKAAGKSRYHFYQAHLSDKLVLRINREQALRQAIDQDEFVLHYQPRVDTLTGKLCSVEALVRWMHPERGLVPPLEFIQVAEDTGLILKLGRIVIEKACAQIAQWKLQGLPVVPVSINVSALQFNEGDVKDFLGSCMTHYDIDPTLIGVELTESCMAGEGDTVFGELDGLRALGVKLLVDDFGTGYSSLSQLQRLNVDVLKVDRAFTLTLCDGNEGKALFKAIVSMADALDICIVAEGVETAEQLSVLQSLSCDEVQGHFVSMPVPAGEMAALMLKRFLFPATWMGHDKAVPA